MFYKFETHFLSLRKKLYLGTNLIYIKYIKHVFFKVKKLGHV